MKYDIELYRPIDYYKRLKKLYGLKWLFGLADTYYPRFLAMGICDYNRKKIIICTVGNWKLRILHELGHACGFKHTFQFAHVMHPWGFLRGYLGAEKIDDNKDIQVELKI